MIEFLPHGSFIAAVKKINEIINYLNNPTYIDYARLPLKNYLNEINELCSTIELEEKQILKQADVIAKLKCELHKKDEEIIGLNNYIKLLEIPLNDKPKIDEDILE
jgi:hypothetical protein